VARNLVLIELNCFFDQLNLEPMLAQVTQGVKVSVMTEFQQDYSNPEENHFVFTYKIRIENHSPNTIQLLRRKWYIIDILGINREVEGEGVIGKQPIIEPGEYHEYVSGCNLTTGIGKMIGTYEMERQVDGSIFIVQVPEFVMVVPWSLN
jgi:ApaG protein